MIVLLNWRDLRHGRAGGAEVYCSFVAERLAELGQEVVLLTSRDAGLPARERVGGYEVRRYGGPLSVYPLALAWLAWHRREVEGVIDCQNGIPFFSPLVLSRRTPVVLVVHHVHQAQFARYLGKMAARVGRWLEGPASRWLYGTRAVAALSPSTRRGVRQTLRLRGPIHVVPPGCRPPQVSGVRARTEWPSVVCVGRLVPHKRYEILVRAWPNVVAALPDATLDLVGGGVERERLEHLAGSLGIAGSVRFYGELPSGSCDDLLRRGWLTVNPSAGEGWGLTVLEANAIGVPVVAFRVDGIRDAVRDGTTGWLVGSAGELGPQIVESLRLLASPHAARDWSARCRAWSSCFDWASTAAQLRALLCAERERRAPGRRERRRPSDLAMVLQVRDGLLPDGWTQRLRGLDRVVRDGETSAVLLPGADPAGVRSIWARLGGTPASLGASIVAVARPADHVLPGGLLPIQQGVHERDRSPRRLEQLQ